MTNQDTTLIKWVLIFVVIEFLQLIGYYKYPVKKKIKRSVKKWNHE